MGKKYLWYSWSIFSNTRHWQIMANVNFGSSMLLDDCCSTTSRSQAQSPLETERAHKISKSGGPD